MVNVKSKPKKHETKAKHIVNLGKKKAKSIIWSFLDLTIISMVRFCSPHQKLSLFFNALLKLRTYMNA